MHAGASEYPAHHGRRAPGVHDWVLWTPQCEDTQPGPARRPGRRASEPGLAIMENYGEGVWRGWRTIRRGDWKLTYVPGYEPELFNLTEDPDEWCNRAADPACAAARADLEARVLDNWAPDACDEARWQKRGTASGHPEMPTHVWMPGPVTASAPPIAAGTHPPH